MLLIDRFRASGLLYSEFFGLRLESVGMVRADQLEFSALERLDSESKGFVLLANQNRRYRIALINQSFKPEGIGSLTSSLIGKPIRIDADELMGTIGRKYVQ